MDNLLTKGQIRHLAKAYTDNADMMFKVTNKQVGNGIGSILATIGIPLILDAIKGKGVGRGGPRNWQDKWWCGSTCRITTSIYRLLAQYKW